MRPTDLARVGRFAWGVYEYARADLSPAAMRAGLAARLASRDERFLALLHEGVYRRPGSPYLALLRHAGIEEADVAAQVRAHGVDAVLRELYASGVTLTADESRGRVPVVRPGGFELRIGDGDLDNPLLRDAYRGTTGGSTGAPRRTVLDPADLLEEAVHQALWVESTGTAERPLVIWRSVPPSRAGIRNVFRAARLGPRLEAWYTPTRPGVGRTSLADWAALRSSLAAGRAAGLRLPSPVHVSTAEPGRVAGWLAARVSEGRAPVLDAPAGACLRVVVAARGAGLDIAGTLFRCGGEPLTDAKLRLIEEAGCVAASHYAMSEVSRVAIACADPVAPDDAHVLTDKLALLPVPRGDGNPAVVLTSLSRHTSKLFLNVDTGDTAVVETRRCRCALGAVGLDVHVHTIRSPEKLTSEGVTFLAGDVLDLVETVLPARFGGSPGDYQLVEHEVEGRSRVSVVVSPRLGAVDEQEAMAVVLAALADGPSYRGMMAATLAGAESLRIVRREPFVTGVGKVPALHKPR